MNSIIMILVAGISGTIMMDLLNSVFSRIGVIANIEIGVIGRMANGWVHGHFFYKHPNEMNKAPSEVLFGYITHYLIGIVLAIPYILGWLVLFRENPSAIYAIVYGTLTTIVSWFFVYPSMGLGVLGLKYADGYKAAYSSLANHLFYGIGLAAGITLI